MTFKLHDLPENERPRERLMSYGKNALSNAELIAIFLRTGVKGENVLAIANKLIAQAGSLDALAKLEAPEIQKIAKGIGPAKAATLAAAFELGHRAVSIGKAMLPLACAEAVYAFMIPRTRSLTQEKIFTLVLDTKMQLIKMVEISSGSHNSSIASPGDILKPAIIHNSHNIIIVHNHPSGDPTPSQQDIAMTRKIAEAAALLDITLADHIIMGIPNAHNTISYYSFRKNGKLP